MGYSFAWITRSLMHQQLVARRNAATATALCSERRRQREEVDAYLAAHRHGTADPARESDRRTRSSS